MRKNTMIRRSILAILACAFLGGCGGLDTDPADVTRDMPEVTTVTTTISVPETTGTDAVTAEPESASPVTGDTNPDTGETCNVGVYSFEVPQGWTCEVDEAAGCVNLYPEESEGYAYLSIGTIHLTKDGPTTFDTIKEKHDSGALEELFGGWAESHGTISDRYYEKDSLKGYLYSCDYVYEDLNSSLIAFFAASELDGYGYLATFDIFGEEQKEHFWDIFENVMDSASYNGEIVKVSWADITGYPALISDAIVVPNSNDDSESTRSDDASISQDDDTKEAEVDEEEYTWVLNINTKRIHYPTCASVNQMKEKNKRISHKSLQELWDEGYVSCGNCKPH